jgi:hypothetical protein
MKLLSVTAVGTAGADSENGQRDLQNCMNEAAFSNCSAEGYSNRDKGVHTDPGPVDIDELLKNSRESLKGRDEEESDIVI